MKNRRTNKRCRYNHLYLDADRYFCVNHDDTELIPIYISLPKPPPYYLIDGYGLHPYEQKFKRLEVPERLKQLEKRTLKEANEWRDINKSQRTIKGYILYKIYWDILEEEQDDYEQEIEWIRQYIWYTIYGYWCFIKGKPYYFPPQYFAFLNHWFINEIKSYPEFRYEDLKTELYKWYLYTTKETFKHLDEKGRALRNQYGEYEMVEMDNRTFFGIAKTKRRRCGESNRALNNVYEITRKGISKTGKIVADTGVHAEEHWDKRFIPSWQHLPFFLKPLWDGNNAPTSLNCVPPSNVYDDKGTDSRLSFAESGGERVVDSDRVDAILLDESGKLVRSDASNRYGVTKFTLHQGPNIHGWVEMPTTIEEMDEGGEEFHLIWDQSCFYERDRVSGQTKSGVGREFVPAYRAYDKFIDAWGFSVINTPTDEQIEYAPKGNAYAKNRIGAKEYHEKRRQTLLASGSPKDLKSYRELVRKEPIDSTECWMSAGGDVGFPIEQMNVRKSELSVSNYKDIVVGDFILTEGVSQFVEKPNGKWNVSLLLDNNHNIKYRSNEQTLTRRWYGKDQTYRDVFAPVHKSRFVMGVDPIENVDRQPGGYYQTTLSDAGMAIYWCLDEELEKKLGHTSTDDYESMRFIATYRNRPNNYFDLIKDIIAAAKYYGAMIFFERNKIELQNRITDEKYDGYFIHMFNIKTNLYDATPGGYAGGESINNLFNSLRDHFDLRVHKECHHDLIQEGLDIKNKSQLKRKDLLAAAGWALEGAKSNYGKLIDKKTNSSRKLDLRGTFLQPRRY